MRKILLGRDTLRLKTPILELDESGKHKKWCFLKVRQNEEVNKYAIKGKDAFLSHFFEDTASGMGVFKRELYNDLNYIDAASLNIAVINQLFSWRIYVQEQGGSGRIVYSLDWVQQKTSN